MILLVERFRSGGTLAQLVEHRTENPGVAGSIPAPPIQVTGLVETPPCRIRNFREDDETFGFRSLRIQKISPPTIAGNRTVPAETGSA